MKEIISILLIVWTLTACNDNGTSQEAKPEIPEEEQIKAAIVKYPDSLLLRETLMQYYRDNGKYDQAISEIDQLLLKDSSNPRFYDIKAILHFENGDTVTAIRSFEKAIRIWPAPEYLIPLGMLYAQTKNPKALQLADTLLKKDVKAEKEVLFIKGLYHSFNNEKQKAIIYFDKALESNHTFMEAYREKGIALYDLGKYNESLAVLDKAVTLQNNFEEGYYYKGRTLEKLNRKEDAIAAYEMALMYDAEYVEAKTALDRLKN